MEYTLIPTDPFTLNLGRLRDSLRKSGKREMPAGPPVMVVGLERGSSGADLLI